MTMRIALWLTAAVLLAAGPSAAATPAGDDAEFFMNLAYKPTATVGDACRAVAMLDRGRNELLDPAAAAELLSRRDVIREGWAETLDEPLTKGTLAYMVCQALGIEGGLTMRLLGPSPRYCLREARFLGLMTGGATYQHCTGGELVSVIDRADNYQRAGDVAARPGDDDPFAGLGAGEQPQEQGGGHQPAGEADDEAVASDAERAGGAADGADGTVAPSGNPGDEATARPNDTEANPGADDNVERIEAEPLRD